MLNELIYKQPLVIFLGAGASTPLGMQTTVEFLNSVRRNPKIKYQLLTNKIIENTELSKEDELDIEAVLDCLENFIEGRELYQKVSGLSLTKADNYTELRDQIKDLVITHYSKIEADDAFNHYKSLFTASLTSTIPIFTTNYDLSIEKAFEHQHAQFRLIDGFHRRRQLTPKWSANAYGNYKPRKKGKDIILFKLHGSVNWVRTPSHDIQRVDSGKRDPGNLKTVIVYPTRIKREIHEEPFRTNYDYLLACLTNAKLCVVIGFSFRDREIAEHFREATGMNSNLSLLIFDTNEEAMNRYVKDKFYSTNQIVLTTIPTNQSKENIDFAVTELLKRLHLNSRYFPTTGS